MRFFFATALALGAAACSTLVSVDDLDSQTSDGAAGSGGEQGGAGQAGKPGGAGGTLAGGAGSGGSPAGGGGSPAGSGGSPAGGAGQAGAGQAGAVAGASGKGGAGQAGAGGAGGAGAGSVAGASGAGQAGGGAGGAGGGAGAGGAGGAGAGGAGAGGAGAGGAAGAGGLEIDESCPQGAPLEIHKLDVGKQFAAFGASAQGLGYAEVTSDTPYYIARKPLLGGATSASLQGPGGQKAPRMVVHGDQVYGLAGGSFFTYSLDGSMGCTESGVLKASFLFGNCQGQEGKAVFAVDEVGAWVAIGTQCGLQVVGKKTGCVAEVIWVQQNDEVKPVGQAQQTIALATDGKSLVWGLEYPPGQGELHLKRKEFSEAITNAYKSETLLAKPGDARELSLDGKNLYTIVTEGGLSRIARFDAAAPGEATFLTEGLGDIQQLTARGGALYWVEEGFSKHRIWAQQGNKRRVLACPAVPVEGLTITKNAAVWRDREAPSGQQAAIHAVEL